jgi:phosphatidylglycerophosphate synthase
LPNQRRARHAGNEAARTAANVLTITRVVVGALILWLAFHHQGRPAGIALLAAGLTDFFDGRLARMAGPHTRSGAQLDGAADMLLLFGAGGAIAVLHPAVWRENAALLAVAAILYLCGVAAGVVHSRRFADPRQMSAKVAGAALYGFAAVTLLGGIYVPLLLELAALTLVMSSLETIARAATIIIQPIARARRLRSQTPQAWNVVKSSTPPPSSIPSSAAAMVQDTRP